MVDGMSDQVVKLDWGSDLTSVKTSCGAGWQVLATSSAEETGDSVRAYEFPDRDPVAVSAAVDFRQRRDYCIVDRSEGRHGNRGCEKSRDRNL